MSHPTSMLTADQLLSLPAPDGLLGYELVLGEPVEVSPASFVHGRLITPRAASSPFIWRRRTPRPRRV